MILLSEYHASSIRLWRVVLLRSGIRLATSDIRYASFRANRISLKPKGFNITIAVAIISLRRSRNITLVFSADLCYNGANKKPPFCKGKWQPKADGGIVKKPKIAGNNPSVAKATAPFTQGSLWMRSFIFRGMGLCPMSL